MLLGSKPVGRAGRHRKGPRGDEHRDAILRSPEAEWHAVMCPLQSNMLCWQASPDQ